LDEAGIVYVAHHQRFEPTSPDVEWIETASQQGWIAITRDQNVRRKPNELAVIRASRAIIFVFTSGNLSAEDTARILLRALPGIYRLVRGTKRPALFSIRRNGTTGRLTL